MTLLYVLGVTLGDIGNKLGYGAMDNGFLMFNNYRVPRDAMLMRYARVSGVVYTWDLLVFHLL